MVDALRVLADDTICSCAELHSAMESVQKDIDEFTATLAALHNSESAYDPEDWLRVRKTIKEKLSEASHALSVLQDKQSVVDDTARRACGALTDAEKRLEQKTTELRKLEERAHQAPVRAR